MSPFVFHFYSSCLDQPGVRVTSTGLARASSSQGTNAGHGF